MDSTNFGERLQDHADAPRLCPDLYHARDYTYCQYAKTVTGLDPNSEKYVVVGVTCKRWGCPFCASRKIRRLAHLTKEAKPNRLLTLTVSTKRFTTPQAAWDAMALAFPELIRAARKLSTEVEYLKVLEIHKSGYPHFHCLLRSGFLKHSIMITEWRRLIGEPECLQPEDDKPGAYAGVNIEKVDESFRTYWYLVKYLTKLHSVPFTDRRVSYSRGFFNEADLEQVEYAKLDEIQRYDQHPWVWLRERYAWETVAVLDHGKWMLDGPIQEPHYKVDPRSLGLPGEPDAEPPLPLKQRLAPGLQDAQTADEDDGRTAAGKSRRTPAKKRKAAPAQWPPPPSNQPVPETPF